MPGDRLHSIQALRSLKEPLMERTVATPAIAVIGLAGLTLVLAADAPNSWDDRPDAAGVRELHVPSGWEGEWSFRFDIHDPVTGRLSSTEEGATVICPGDHLGLSMYASRRAEPRCEGSIDGDGLGLACRSTFVHGSCRVDFSVDVNVARHFDTMNGAGEWRIVGTAGDCVALLEHAPTGESFRLTGARRGTDLRECASAPASLIEKMLSQPELIALAPPPITGLTAAAEGPTVNLEWAAVPKAKAYEIRRAVGQGRFKAIAEVIGHRSSFRDTSLERGHEYRYVVRWITADGRVSPMSSEVRVTP